MITWVSSANGANTWDRPVAKPLTDAVCNNRDAPEDEINDSPPVAR